MSESARIDSVDSLKELRTFLCGYAKKISVAIDEAEVDIAQTLNWVKNDRYPFWQNEVRVRGDQLTKAKLELKNKQLFEKSALGGHNSFIDEKRAVARAEQRFEEAQNKFNKVKSWIPRLETQSYDCRGALQGLANLITIDLPNRRTEIDQMIYALESYVGLVTPMAGGSEEQTMARPVQEEEEEKKIPNNELQNTNKFKMQNSKSETDSGTENKENDEKKEDGFLPSQE
jgi:hypothetical protein